MALTAEERILIARAVKRDREAFATLYVHYHDAVIGRILPITQNRDEAEDLASETFLRAWNAIDRFETRDVSIRAWLCTIADRLALKHVKRRRPNLNIDDLSIESGKEEWPEMIAERAAETAAVRQALIELPSIQQQVLSQRFLHHRSYDDVAASLGKSAATVRVIQHRGLAALRCIMLKRPGVSTGVVK